MLFHRFTKIVDDGFKGDHRFLTARDQVNSTVRACVCVCVCVCHNEKSARRMASTTSDTGDTSSKQQQAQRKENYNKRKRPVSSVDHCHPYRRKKEKRSSLLNLHMLQSTCFGT